MFGGKKYLVEGLTQEYISNQLEGWTATQWRVRMIKQYPSIPVWLINMWRSGDPQPDPEDETTLNLTLTLTLTQPDLSLTRIQARSFISTYTQG